ncbi:barstar family protein [Actinoplanes xinjiangensis]|uniref:barstar family protein n=1 Tax=Actinoplanes xinjiangensis TaxID=512350 RepID=UPI0034243FE3
MADRWLLRGTVGDGDSGDDGAPIAECREIDGLFVDLPPRPRESFTLLGCLPEGTLATCSDGDRLGNVWLATGPIDGEELCDVVVRGRRPSDTVAGAVDIDLDGFVDVYDRTAAVDRPRDVTAFVLTGPDDMAYGRCADVAGVFRAAGPPPVPQVRLLGCRPEPVLSAALETIGRTGGTAARRRMISSEVEWIGADGTTHPVILGGVVGTVSAVEPSRFGAGLVDVTVDSSAGDPLPTGYLDILRHWETGRPPEKNLWAGYGRELRLHWCGVALAHHAGRPDRPPGATYRLDGRFVTDVEGFYAALGEAINGPGGYFGWNLDAVDDCCGGGFGATTPFRVVWHDSAVARSHLVAGYDPLRLRAAVTVDYLVDLLTREGVQVELR